MTAHHHHPSWADAQQAVKLVASIAYAVARLVSALQRH
jgi:hypothetical protein